MYIIIIIYFIIYFIIIFIIYFNIIFQLFYYYSIIYSSSILLLFYYYSIIIFLLFYLIFTLFGAGTLGWPTKSDGERPCPGLTGISRSKTTEKKKKEKKFPEEYWGVKISIMNQGLFVLSFLLFDTISRSIMINHLTGGNFICRPIYPYCPPPSSPSLSLISICKTVHIIWMRLGNGPVLSYYCSKLVRGNRCVTIAM